MASLSDPTELSASVHFGMIGRGRVVLSLVAIVLLLMLLIGRLVYLQIFEYSEFATRSSDNRVEIVPIPPVRGRIYDRNGVLLAGNTTVYTLGIIPAYADDLEQLLSEIQTIVPISESEVKSFRKSIKIYGRFELHILKDYLDDRQVGRLAVERYKLPGAYINAELHRNYTSGESASHVVGRLSRIDERDVKKINRARYRGIQYIGKYGAELSSEENLVGWSGHERVETNAHGQKVRTLSQVLPTSGEDIYLTIDYDLQRLAYEAMGDRKGALVALQPATGRILAMVSRPSYDPNNFAVFSEPGKALELLQAENSPLLNRAIQGQYPPGSTIKPFLTVTGHENSYHKERYNCPGFYQLSGVKKKFRCWKKQGHGWVDYKSAVAQSCDVFFYSLAKKLGIDRMHAGLSKFGFGEATGIDLSNEKSGILPSKQWKREVLNEPWYRGETLFTGIGQSYISVTMLQLAHATSIIANRGLKFTPQIIYKTVDVNTDEQHIFNPQLTGKIDVNKQYLEEAVNQMVEVVHGERGTARHLGKGAKYTIAGKTGTVQVIGRAQDEEWDEDKVAEKHLPHGIFTAFAPAEDPQIVVAVVIENGKSGSAIAPIAKTVMDHYLLNTKNKDQGGEVAYTSTQ